MSEVTRVLTAISQGDSQASAELLPLVYDELRRLAQARMAREPAGHTLQPTALVHEAYLRLLGDQEVRWDGRGHFFAAAAEAMRRILIERARAKAGPQRGGGRARVPLDLVDLATQDDPAEILAFDEAISRLEEKDADAARVVRLRFYAGLSIDEVAQVLGTSPRTVNRDWTFARAFLMRELGDS